MDDDSGSKTLPGFRNLTFADLDWLDTLDDPNDGFVGKTEFWPELGMVVTTETPRTEGDEP